MYSLKHVEVQLTLWATLLCQKLNLNSHAKPHYCSWMSQAKSLHEHLSGLHGLAGKHFAPQAFLFSFLHVSHICTFWLDLTWYDDTAFGSRVIISGQHHGQVRTHLSSAPSDLTWHDMMTRLSEAVSSYRVNMVKSECVKSSKNLVKQFQPLGFPAVVWLCNTIGPNHGKITSVLVVISCILYVQRSVSYI